MIRVNNIHVKDNLFQKDAYFDEDFIKRCYLRNQSVSVLLRKNIQLNNIKILIRGFQM